jgi:hypothetical protein
MRIYIVTEGNSDLKFLEQNLPDRIKKMAKIVSAGGYSSALSTVRSLLVSKRGEKIILLVDTDTYNKLKAEEKRSFIENYLQLAPVSGDYKILLANPNLEDAQSEDRDNIIQEITHFVEAA